MGFFQNLTGEIRVRLTGADISASVDAILKAGIILKDTVPEDDLNLYVTVSRRDYRKLADIAGRRGDLLRIVGKHGIYWDLRGLRKRPVFVCGLLFLFAMAMLLPSRILFVEVQGNGRIPENRIIEQAAECGISFGASRRAVRSEKVKNALLEAMPELAWAGVNTYGCRAVITVREREQEPRETTMDGVSHLIAGRDGIVLSCDVTAGTAQCVPGQAVQAGEVLISGYTDCGLCLTATRAAGEVMAATTRSLTAVMPSECLKKENETVRKVNYSLIVGKIRINFHNNSGILDASCGRMVTNYHLTLPGGFRLPVTLAKETIIQSGLSISPSDGAVLDGFAARYLETQMIAGTVKAAVESVAGSDGVWILTGEYACTEMIARVQAEQNGELHETN